MTLAHPKKLIEVAPEVIGILSILKGAMDRRSLQVAMELNAAQSFGLVYLRPRSMQVS